MVELIEAKILDKLAPKEPVTLTFGNSLNEISYEKRYIFNFLLFRICCKFNIIYSICIFYLRYILLDFFVEHMIYVPPFLRLG